MDLGILEHNALAEDSSLLHHRWINLAMDAMRRKDWEEVLMCASAAFACLDGFTDLTKCSCFNPMISEAFMGRNFEGMSAGASTLSLQCINSDIAISINFCVRCLKQSVSMLLPKGWMPAADAARKSGCLLSQGMREKSCIPRRLVTHGGAASLGIVAFIQMGDADVDLIVTLSGDEAMLLQPLLQAAVNASPNGGAPLLKLEEEEGGPQRGGPASPSSFIAPTLQDAVPHAPRADKRQEPSSGSMQPTLSQSEQQLRLRQAAATHTVLPTQDALVWTMPLLGFSAAEATGLWRARCALGPNCIASPCAVEVHVALLDASPSPSHDAARKDERSHASEHGRPPLLDLLIVRRSLYGFDMGAVRAAATDGPTPPTPLDLSQWSARALGEPTLALHWVPSATAYPSSCRVSLTARCSGMLSALAIWMDLEIVPGTWSRRTPVSAEWSDSASSCMHPSRPHAGGTLLEPHLACVVEPRRVRAGETLHVELSTGTDGLRAALLASARTNTFDEGQRAGTLQDERCDPAPRLPAWCFLMMNDGCRSDWYRQAISAAVDKASCAGKRSLLVLDLGCGAGLLTLLSALAAASHPHVQVDVLAVECVPHVAALARAVLAANARHFPPNFRAKVIEADAASLSAAAVARCWAEERAEERECKDKQMERTELPASKRAKAASYSPQPRERRADIIVTETFGDDPLAEGVLPLLTHAARELLSSDGMVVPATLKVFCALASAPAAQEQLRFCPGSGSNLAVLEPESVALPLHLLEHRLLSDPVLMHTIDLTSAADAVGCIGEKELSSAGCGQAICYVSWFELHFDGCAALSTKPGAGSHWRQMARLLPQPVRENLAGGGTSLRVRIRFQVTGQHLKLCVPCTKCL